MRWREGPRRCWRIIFIPVEGHTPGEEGWTYQEALEAAEPVVVPTREIQAVRTAP